ncbi:MAG: restriction endonuclease subunit S [Dermatophilaceae bacterium]
MTSVGDILELSYGKALKESDRDGGDVPVVGSGGVVGGHSTGITDAPTIVVGRKGSIGSVTWVDGPAWPIDTAYFVKPKREDLDRRWAYWMLRSLRMETMNKSAAVPGLNRDDVYRLNVTLPPLAEQRRIAAILDHADALRAKRPQVLARLDELEQATFLSMFGHDRELRSVSDLCELVVDCVNRTAPVVDSVTPYKMLRTTNIRNGAVDTSNVRYVDQAVFEKWNRRATPERGDVILTREAPVGEAGVLLSDEKVFLGQRLMLYRVNPAMMTPDYLAACFRSPVLQEQFNRLGSGSTVKHLPLPACRNFQIPVAPINEQQRFSERIASINAFRDSIRAQATSELALFGALQSRAFQGEL